MDSITQPTEAQGAVIVAGSHGGISSGRYAAQLGPAGVIFNDAGIGKNGAGVEALAYLDGFNLPAATVDYQSAQIGDGVDMAQLGSISHINKTADKCGCEVGQHALQCAGTMHDEQMEPVSADVNGETNQAGILSGETPVWTLDSIGLISKEHVGSIVITGSHGERFAGELDSYIQTNIAGITLFDAGIGKDCAGIGRLDTMDEKAIPAATVDVSTACIGDAASAWRTGVFSRVNDTATSMGILPKDSCSDFVEKIQESKDD